MPTDLTYQPGIPQRHQDGSLDVQGAFSLKGTALTPTAAQLNSLGAGVGTVAFDRLPKVAKVALGAVDTGGGVLSWANPEAVTILITSFIVDVTTKSSAACTVDFGGTATNGTTQSDTLLDGLDVGTAIGTFGLADQAGANGRAQIKLASGKWVTGSKDSGASAGLVGFVYITYLLI